MAKTTRPQTEEAQVSLPVVIINDKEKLQQQLHETIAKIDEKLAQLEGTKTAGKASLIGTVYFDQYNATYGGQVPHLQTETNLVSLLNLAARIRMAKREYEESAEAAGLTKYPAFTWGGHSGTDLISQIEARVRLVSNTNVIAQLKAEKKKLEAFLSEEDRLAATLQSLSSLLKDK